MRAFTRILTAALVGLMLTGLALAVPLQFNHQGRLLDPVGAPAVGPQNMTFSLYFAATGGSPLWTETQNAVQVDAEGLYDVLLGSVVSIPDNLFDGSLLYLGVTVSPDPEMSPRIPLVSSPYSLKAAQVEGFSSGPGNISLGEHTLVGGDSNSVIGDYGVALGINNMVEPVNQADTTLDTSLVQSRTTGYFDAASLFPFGAGAVLSGGSNTVFGINSVVAGGCFNDANAGLSGVLGGFDNDIAATAFMGTIGGGIRNRVNDRYSFVGGGALNVTGAGAIMSGVGGGLRNDALGRFSWVSGGLQNQATGGQATVGGGRQNVASGLDGTVGGGYRNAAAGVGATASGGDGNTAGSDWSTAGGGFSNNVGADYATIGGGQSNAVNGTHGTVGGGENNSANGNWGTVGGGQINQAPAIASTVSGGFDNGATFDYSTVAGGAGNLGNAIYGSIGGGEINIVNPGATHATIGGGFQNSTLGTYATVSGGGQNAAGGNWSTTGGGNGNSTPGNWATVGGGQNNQNPGIHGTIAGGLANATAGALAPTVGGGQANQAAGNYATVAGGEGNVAGNLHAFIGGGNANNATGQAATVSGGNLNQATGPFATVPGGEGNIASGTHSWAGGMNARAVDSCSFVWADCCTDATGVTGLPMYSSGTNTFTARATNGFYLFTSCDTIRVPSSAGVQLPPGGSAWAALSDRNSKENISLVNSDDVLKKVAGLPVYRWNYKAQDESIKHIGPMAQDFYDAFGVGDNNTTISSIDPAGIALAAIQALYLENEELKAKVAEIDELRDELKRSTEMLEQLSLLVRNLPVGPESTSGNKDLALNNK